jgi:type I restriction enzyme M protein
MLGAIIGDIVGSRYEFNNIKTKSFPLFDKTCRPTDDSIMTLAIARAILACNGDYAKLEEQAVYWMRKIGQPYPGCGYGGRFYQWMYDESMGAYHSFGNGAAMRVSPCGFVANSLEEAKSLSKAVTEVTHDHPEGLKGAEATAVAIYLARIGSSKEEIRAYMVTHYYPLDFTLDSIRDSYRFNETCQGSVPQAIEAFLESTGFEDAIRNAISIGGDSDTLAAITGGIAQAYYGVPDDIRTSALNFLNTDFRNILSEFEAKFPLNTPTGR